MNYLQSNLELITRKQGLTQTDLAELAGVSQATISKMMRGKTKNSSKLTNVAVAVGCTSEELRLGVYEPTTEYLTEKKSKATFLPLISNEQALKWNKDSINNIQQEKTTHNWYVTSLTQSKNAFWLSVTGDTMSSKVGLSVPDGYCILVDADKKAKDGDLVVMTIDDKQLIFKQFVVDVNNKYIKPLNDSYSMMPLDDEYRIIGVVLESKCILTSCL